MASLPNGSNRHKKFEPHLQDYFAEESHILSCSENCHGIITAPLPLDEINNLKDSHTFYLSSLFSFRVPACNKEDNYYRKLILRTFAIAATGHLVLRSFTEIWPKILPEQCLQQIQISRFQLIADTVWEF